MIKMFQNSDGEWEDGYGLYTTHECFCDALNEVAQELFRCNYNDLDKIQRPKVDTRVFNADYWIPYDFPDRDSDGAFKWPDKEA